MRQKNKTKNSVLVADLIKGIQVETESKNKEFCMTQDSSISSKKKDLNLETLQNF